MALVSFAQNFEDLMLWRALGHIDKGLYIDVGAQHPSLDSVSRCFYDNGWRGVHVEPTPTYAEMLRNARPDETVLQAAAGATVGLTKIYEISGTGLSTGRPDIATHHAANGHEAPELQVPCTTLAEIFGALGERPIHWLKIDVEGMEREVLEGWGDHPARPWVLVIESTFPGTRRPTETEWLELVISRGYREVWFDGLNRFFVAQGHDDLAAAFDLPPNIFDGFAISLDHLMASGLRHEGQLKDERHSQVRAELTILAEAAQLNEQTMRAEFQRIVGDLSAAERRAATMHEQASKQATELQAELAHIRGEHAQRTDEFYSLQRAALDREQALADQISSLTSTVRDQAAQLEQERIAAAGMIAESSSMRRELETQAADLSATRSELTARVEDFRALTQVANDREQVQMAQISRLADEIASQNARLDYERRTTSELAERLTTLREAVSEYLERTRLPFARMQAALLGSAIGLDEEVFAESALSGFTSPNGAALSIADLLRRHDDDFIKQAYRIVLGREPDIAGYTSYLDALRAGTPKERIIAALARSIEGRQYGSTLPGLAKLLRTVPKRPGYFARQASARLAFARRCENALGLEITELARLID